MANDQGTSYGLKPLDQPYGNRRLRYYKADTGNNIYLFTPLTLNAVGKVVTQSSAAIAPFQGVAVEFLDSNKASLPTIMTALSSGAFLPSGNEGYVGVIDDPNQMYIIEEGTDSTALTYAAVGQGCILGYIATSGNGATGWANLVINESSLTTTTACNYQIVAMADLINSDGTTTTSGNFCKWIVRPAVWSMGPIGLSTNI